MFPIARLLSLPASLLLLFASTSYVQTSQELEWPFDLPAHAKYYPEHASLLRREQAIERKLQQQNVVGVKKMSDDEGEKFFLDYWSFPPDGMPDTVFEEQDWADNILDDDNDDFGQGAKNGSLLGHAKPPFRPHHSSHNARDLLPRYLRFAMKIGTLNKRDFQCPSGTSSCASISRPEACCAQGQTCQQIQDTGLGDVGCCPEGQACGGSLSDCGSGFTSCPTFDNGGCCIPGYACVTGGCARVSTATVLVNPSTRTTTTPTSTTTPTTAPTTAPRSSPTSNIAPSSASRSNSLVCTAGFRSCPASLGGGCCPTNRACGRQECPETTGGTIGPPVRPTSNEPQVTTTTSDDPLVTGCPTGFYACSAVYQGGCCRYGRDCAATSCPTGPLTTLVDGSVVTILATTNSGLSANEVPTGVCATGWSSCPASDLGGCCPTGYLCGVSCTATATVSGSLAPAVAKLPPQNGASRVLGNYHGASCFAAILVLFSLRTF